VKLLEVLKERRRRRRERADRTLVAAKTTLHEPSSLSKDAERLRSESRRNTMLPPDL
jgi:hypothetical protein